MIEKQRETTTRRPRLRPELKIDLQCIKPLQQKAPESSNHFSGVASRLTPQVFIGDVETARNSTLLHSIGITHILNCAGMSTPNFYPNEFHYKDIPLQDNPSEDIFCLFYFAIEFIEDAVNQGGTVLIHCKCGISRSSAMAIAYLMYVKHYNYDQAFSTLKKARAICSPNAGFIMSLLNWQTHLKDPLLKPRLYKIEHALTNSGPRQVGQFLGSSDECYITQTNRIVFVWVGSNCKEANVELAKRFAQQLQKYENSSSDVQTVYELNENPTFQLHISSFLPETEESL